MRSDSTFYAGTRYDIEPGAITVVRDGWVPVVTGIDRKRCDWITTRGQELLGEAILCDFIDDDEIAALLHPEFVIEVVSTFTVDGFRLNGEQLRDWVSAAVRGDNGSHSAAGNGDE